MDPMTPIELPQVGEAAPPRERADAARNRERVLCAAARLFAEQGVGCTSMEDIAVAAGVGKGTLFRRFGDRASLARAVLGDRETAWQDEVLRGPPPLGPGAPAVDRIVAFGRGLLELHGAHLDLLVAAEAGGLGRLRAGPYPTYRLHLTILLREAAPACDPEYTADVLLSALAADLVLHQRDTREMGAARVADGFERLVRSLCDG